MDNLWTRRTNSSKLSLSTPGAGQNDLPISSGRNASFARRLGGDSSAPGGKATTPFNNSAFTPGGSGLMSPGGGGASSAFGLGSGAFAAFGSAKTPKSPGNPFDFAPGSKTPSTADKGDSKTTTAAVSSGALAGATAGSPGATASSPTVTATATGSIAGTLAQHPLRTAWVFWFRPPISKANGYIEYEKTLHAMAEVGTVEEFFSVYGHLKRPSDLPLVSDYHLFRKGVRPIWEDDENRKGGKWIVRLKKGVADHFWEDLLLAIVGDQFQDAGEEVNGAVLSVRNGEDILSVWVRRDGGKVVKIRETMKRVLGFRPDTKVEWKSHEGSIQQRTAIDDMRRERAAAGNHSDKRSKQLGSGGGGGGGAGQFGSAGLDDYKQQGGGGGGGVGAS